MEILFSQTIGAPIVDQHSHNVVGSVLDVLIDPESGAILAFLLPRHSMVVPVDIIEWQRDHLVISSEEHILGQEEVVRVHEVLKKDIHVFANKVITESGGCVGRVVDMVFDCKLFVLKKLFAAKLFLFFKYAHRLISAKHILEIKKHKILVSDLSVKQTREAEMPELAAV